MSPAHGFHGLNNGRTSVRIRAPHQWIFSGADPSGHFLFDARLRTTYTLTSLAFTGRAQPVHTEHPVGCGTLGEIKGS